MTSTDYKVLKELTALQPDVKSRMKILQNIARKSLKGDTHAIYENQT